MQQNREFKLYSDYELAKISWTAVEKRSFRGLEDGLQHLVPADIFMGQLEMLALVTGDDRFENAAVALREHNVISGRVWTNKTPFNLAVNLEERYLDAACSLINLLIYEGLTKRLAYANCAVHFRWPGNSFEAAVKALERLHQAGKRSEVEDIS